jgi:hypothetical protein
MSVKNEPRSKLLIASAVPELPVELDDDEDDEVDLIGAVTPAMTISALVEERLSVPCSSCFLDKAGN